MANQMLANLEQIKKIYITVLGASIIYYALVIGLSIVVHFDDGNLELVIVLLILGLSLRLMALYGAVKEHYGLTIAFAVIMSFFIVSTFVGLTVGSFHPMNAIAFFLHCVTTALGFLFAHKIRERQLQKLTTVVFCSPSAPALVSASQRPAYYSSASLTAPIQVSIVDDLDGRRSRLDLPPKYEEAIRDSNAQRV